jgi:hypothetical protein
VEAAVEVGRGDWVVTLIDPPPPLVVVGLISTLEIFCGGGREEDGGTCSLDTVLLLMLMLLLPEPLLAGPGIEEVLLFGVVGVGKDFSCRATGVVPTPLGSPLCFARSAKARFIILLLLKENSNLSRFHSRKTIKILLCVSFFV